MCRLLCTPGVAPSLRHLAALEKPTISIRADGAHLDIKTQSSIKTTEISFELGKEFDETTADNRKVKVRPRSPRRSTAGRKRERGGWGSAWSIRLTPSQLRLVLFTNALVVSEADLSARSFC